MPGNFKLLNVGLTKAPFALVSGALIESVNVMEVTMFTEERSSWENEMLTRELIDSARKGFTITLKNAGQITLTPDSPCIDLILYALEKNLRGNHERARMTFIDFLYYWHERLFKQVKRKPRANS